MSESDTDKFQNDYNRKLSFDDSKYTTLKKVKSKIIGLFYGCILGDINSNKKLKTSYSTEQLIIMLNTFIETGRFDISTFAQLLKVHTEKNKEHVPSYIRDLVGSNEYISDTSKRSHDLNEKKRDDESEKYENIPLIRAAVVGMFKTWDNYSVAQCMCTHFDHKCITASILISSCIRSMFLGRDTNLGEIIPDTLQLIFSLNRMKNDSDIKSFMTHTSKEYCKNIKLADLKKDKKNVYKCMNSALWSLYKLCNLNATDDKLKLAPSEHFKDIIKELANEKGDVNANCALSGALMGCEIGYENLPRDWIESIEPELKKCIDNKIVNYLKVLSMVDSNTTDIEDVFIDPNEDVVTNSSKEPEKETN